MEKWGLVAAQLKKFTVADLLEKVWKLEIFPDEFGETVKELGNIKKEMIIKSYLQALQSSVNGQDALAHLNLFYFFLRSSTKIWTIYELINKVVDREELAIDPDILETTLKDQLNDSATSANVAVQLNAGTYWLRIEINDKVRGRRKKAVQSTFFGVYNLDVDNIALAGVKLAHLSKVVKALGNALNFDDAKVTAIKDRSLDGIFQLFAERKNPKFHQFNVETPQAAKPTLDSRIRDLQFEEKSERKRYSESKFGVDNKPPVRKLTFKLQTPFGKNNEALAAMPKDKLFNCRVVFEGKNVISGIQSTVECGITRTPLPTYLADVRTSGKTHTLIRAKD